MGGNLGSTVASQLISQLIKLEEYNIVASAPTFPLYRKSRNQTVFLHQVFAKVLANLPILLLSLQPTVLHFAANINVYIKRKYKMVLVARVKVWTPD